MWSNESNIHARPTRTSVPTKPTLLFILVNPTQVSVHENLHSFLVGAKSNASMCSNGSITHACPTRICVPTKPTLILIPAHRTQASVQMKKRFFIEANLTQISVPTNPTSMRIEGEQGFQQFQHYFSFTRIHSKRSFRLKNMLFCLKRI